jgi:hypothetical protein
MDTVHLHHQRSEASSVDAKSIKAACIFGRSKSYVLVGDKLYKRG